MSEIRLIGPNGEDKPVKPAKEIKIREPRGLNLISFPLSSCNAIDKRICNNEK